MEHHSAMSSFGLENSHVTAIVGGGGKSSLMAALGKEYHRRGETVIMTTTTHITLGDFCSSTSAIRPAAA